jgi:hypothetical protein
MNKYINAYPFFFKRMIAIWALVIVVLSCSKLSDSPLDSAFKYCSTVKWSNTSILSGTFTGRVVNGSYTLAGADITNQGSESIIELHRDMKGHINNDQAGLTFTYDQDNLVNMVIMDRSKISTFSFDAGKHLTKLDIEDADKSGIHSLILNYTYDENDDPVLITGHGVNTLTSGTDTYDLNLTLNYLTDKPNILPFIPETAAFTSYFTYTPFLSRHLINKMEIKRKVTSGKGIALPDSAFTHQYSYTYYANGNVETMTNTGNQNSVFTFAYFDCH